MQKFPTKNFFDLLESNFVTESTRSVLHERLKAREMPPRFFDTQEFEILKAVCKVLAPSEVIPPWFVAGEIDKRLAENKGNGWRYDSMPPDSQAYKNGLQLLNGTAQRDLNKNFAVLEIEKQRDIFKCFKSGKSKQTDEINEHFIEELCAEFSEIFYSHPLALAEIGYIGFADAYGWVPDGDTWRHGDPGGKVEIRQESLMPSHLSISAPSSQEVDAVIIGTGAGGAPILARLAEAGLKVVALEAGKSFDYTKFPTDERVQSKLFWNDERLSAGENAVAFGNNNSGCGVGGSTLHFTAFTPRPQEDDFRIFSEFGVGSDWCLSFKDLEPYFDELEWFLGVSGNSNYPWGKPRKKDYPLPPLPLNGAARLMQRACNKLNIQTSPAPNAVISKDYFQEKVGWRPAYNNRGFCQAGCSTGSKDSWDVTFLPFALKCGAEIRSECFVTEFKLDSNGKIKAVVYSQNGDVNRQRKVYR